MTNIGWRGSITSQVSKIFQAEEYAFNQFKRDHEYGGMSKRIYEVLTLSKDCTDRPSIGNKLICKYLIEEQSRYRLLFSHLASLALLLILFTMLLMVILIIRYRFRSIINSLASRFATLVIRTCMSRNRNRILYR